MFKSRPSIHPAVLLGCMLFASGAAGAAEPPLQQILDQQFGAGVLSATTDQLIDGADSSWSAQPGASATLLFEFAGFRDDTILGLYDQAAPGFRLPLFRGQAGGGDDATLTIESLTGGFRFSVTSGGVTESANFGSSVFGFYLSTPQNNVFFSDSALNSDGTDHLNAFAIDAPGLPGAYDYPPDSYLLAWEDLLNGGDRDYQDLLVSVSGFAPVAEAPAPVPLPGGVLLLGSGLLGLTGLRRRLQATRDRNLRYVRSTK